MTFDVANTNTSELPCSSDGAPYAVSGHLVAPASALRDGGPRAVTLYLHGLNLNGQTHFHLQAVPGYDYATEMARLGHASVVIDKIGYEPSPLPHGQATCFGSEADVAHQIIGALRAGNYSADPGESPSFDRVVLAGHDTGGPVAQIEAYSYRDLDALMVLDYADTGFKPLILEWSAVAGAECGRGGKPARPGGPAGYFDFGPGTDEIAPLGFPNAEPRVIEAVKPLRTRNPCGELSSVPPSVTLNLARVGSIDVPVLIAAGDMDLGFSPDGVRRQGELYTGSDDVTVEILENTGHFPMLSRTAPTFRRIVSEWLRLRDLLSPRARTADGCPAVNRPLIGSPPPDRLLGGSGAERLVGRGGGDLLRGRAGDDCARGSAGDDIARGGPNDDLIGGGRGADRVGGGRGDDVIRGGRGNDVLRGGRGRDVLRCGAGRDVAVAGGNDRTRGCERVRG